MHTKVLSRSSQGVLREAFPQLFALARTPDAIVGDYLDITWSPIFDETMSKQKITEFLEI